MGAIIISSISGINRQQPSICFNHSFVGESSAVVVTQVRKDDKGLETAEDWRTVSIAHMIEFSDLEPKKRRRRSA
jgi:hypothetical protein